MKDLKDRLELTNKDMRYTEVGGTNMSHVERRRDAFGVKPMDVDSHA